MNPKNVTASILGATALIMGGVDASVLDEQPIERIEKVAEYRVESKQIGNVVETTFPWKDQPGIKIKYDLGEPTIPERIEDKRKTEVITEKVDFADGGFKVDLLLNEKPDTNRFCYTVENGEDYSFEFQPPLTEEQKAEGYVRANPEYIDYSYAVYHKTKRNHIQGKTDYGTGKVMHIPRPQVWSLSDEKTKVWAELSYADESLCVTVPQEFLDKAEYPVRVDPTFGFQTLGSTGITLCVGASDTSQQVGWWGTSTAPTTNGFATGFVFGTYGQATTTSYYSAIWTPNTSGPATHSLLTSSELVRGTIYTGGASFTQGSFYRLPLDLIPVSSGYQYIQSMLCDGADIELFSPDTHVLQGDFFTGLSNYSTAESATGASGYATMKADNPWTETPTATTFMYSTYIEYCESGSTCTQAYSTTSTWVAPSGVTSADVACWGGGGGGGDGTNTGGGGGGGGAFASGTVAVTPGVSYPVVVGKGGIGGVAGVAGTAGATSTFATTSIIAAPGLGGAFASAAAAAGGVGGSTANSSGTVEYAGGNGGNSNNTADAGGGGGGGAGPYGAGGNGGTANTTLGGGGGGASGGTAGTAPTAGTSTNAGNGGNANSGSAGYNGFPDFDGGGGGGGGDDGQTAGKGNFPGGGGGGGENNGGDGGNGQCTITFTYTSSFSDWLQPQPQIDTLNVVDAVSSTSLALSGSLASSSGAVGLGFWYATNTSGGVVTYHTVFNSSSSVGTYYGTTTGLTPGTHYFWGAFASSTAGGTTTRVFSNTIRSMIAADYVSLLGSDAGYCNNSTGGAATTTCFTGLTNPDVNNRMGYRPGFGPLTTGFRMQNVRIPQGSTINSAYFYYTALDTDSTNPPTVNIYAETSDNSNTFSGASTSPDAPCTVDYGCTRATTTAFVTWAMTSQTINIATSSPDISSVIQEIVDRPGWVSGNSLTIFMGPADYIEQFRAMTSTSTSGLIIDFTAPGGGGGGGGATSSPSTFINSSIIYVNGRTFYIAH